METPFFPDPLFGWLFVATLAILTGIAAWIDWKTLTVPKPLVGVLLAGGLLFNLVRGAWLGTLGQPGSLLGWTGLTGGMADAFLFSSAGFLVGFGLFLFLWLAGTCGGGDVKLFAAMGSWLGPLWTLYLLLATYLVVLFGFVVLGWFLHVLRHGSARPRQRPVAYSFPVALATLALLLYTCRGELLAAVGH